MRALLGLFVSMAIATAAAGQPPAPSPPPPIDPLTFTSAADIQGLIAKAKAEIKPGQPALFQPILRLAPYRASLEYRVAATPPVAHLFDAEFIYVVAGTGSVTIGGAITAPQPPVNGNILGTAVQGGTTTLYRPGDTFLIPENTPHWFRAMPGPVVLITLHVPRPVAWPR